MAPDVEVFPGLPPSSVVPLRRALGLVRNGHRVFLSSGPAEPTYLIEGLLERYRQLWGVEILHVHAHDQLHFVDARYADHFRYNTFGVSTTGAEALGHAEADHTPMFFSELPRMLRTRRYPLDVALIQVSPPNEWGDLSLGLSVGVTPAAIEGARVVIAQVNRYMPRVRGQTVISVEDVDWFVLHDRPLRPSPPLPGHLASAGIGPFVAELVEDGDVLHVSRDALSQALLPWLQGQRDLGVLTEVLTDGLMELVRAGAVSASPLPGCSGAAVATTVSGSTELFEAVRDSERVCLHPVEVVLDRQRMASLHRMVAIRGAHRVDLTGHSLLDSPRASTRYVGADLDFLRGALLSELGFTLLVLPSLDPVTGESTVVPTLRELGGSLLGRASVHYVCTEHGFAHLHGKTLRERVLAMVAIAHPRHRCRLMAEARVQGLVPEDQQAQPYPACVYPHDLVGRHTLPDGTEVFVRPIHPSDERGLQRLFYGHGLESVYKRYHGVVRSLPRKTLLGLVHIDYRRDIALVAMVGPRGARELVGVGRAMWIGDGRAEVDLIVDDSLQGRGLGRLLLEEVTQAARQRGLTQLLALILFSNPGARRCFERVWTDCRCAVEDGTVTITYDLEVA